jgi:phosphatidate cytidylyltransferase
VEFIKRVTTGIIGILLLILIVNKGGIYLSTSIFILSLIGLNEFYKAIRNTGLNPITYIGVLGTFGFYLSTLIPEITINLVLTLITFLLLTHIFINKIRLEDITITLIGIMYIPFMLFHIFYLDNTTSIWLVFIMSFGTDTFAYIFGNLLGKRKLCPNISPNKTVEGSIGGILGSVVLTLVFAYYMDLNSYLNLSILAIIASITSQIGDLIASKIKRVAHIKDFGKIFPGHGGVLDRFDSIILTAPIIYYYVKYFLI